MNKKQLTIALALVYILSSCSSDTGSDTRILNDTAPKTANPEEIVYDDGGPPFSDTCKCFFEILAEIRTNEKRFDLILSGKNWDSEFYSCSWTWGELISNEFPPDSLVTDFRIHLVDLDKLSEKADTSFLASRAFQENLIATYSRTSHETHMTCRFDPNKTGKYARPKQWVE